MAPVAGPGVWMPGVWIDPSANATNGVPELTGSRLGTIHGLTHLGFTVTRPFGAMFRELEGLKASAVAVALTWLGLLFQMREKKVGSPGWTMLIFTCGFSEKAPPAVQ